MITDKYREVSEEVFKSGLNPFFPNLTVLSVNVGAEYWWITNAPVLATVAQGDWKWITPLVHDELASVAIKIGIRFDNRDLRKLVVEQSFFMLKNLDFLTKFLQQQEEKKCKDFI